MAKKRSQPDLRQKTRFLRVKQRENPKKHLKTKKKVSLIQNEEEEEEEYTSLAFSTSSSSKKNVLIVKNQDYTVSIYTCRYKPLPLSPVPRKNHDFDEMGLIESVKEDEGSESTDFEYDSDQKKKGVLYKVIKCLIVVCAIVLSTLFMSSINPPRTGHLLSLQGYRMIQDSALGNVSLNQSLEREPSLRGATESGYLEKSMTVFDKIHLPDEGEIDLLQVYVNENVVEDSAEHRAVTAVNIFDAMEASNIVGDTDSSGESAKIEAFSYKINEQRKCDVLSTCEVDKSVRGFGEAIVTDLVLAMGGIAALIGGIALLTKTVGFIRRLFTKPSERVPSPAIQECVEPALVEGSTDLLLAEKDENTELKEQFAVEGRLIQLCQFRAPTVELFGEYVVTAGFSMNSPEKYSCESVPVEAQQMKQGMSPDRPSISNQRSSQNKTARKKDGSTTALRRSNRIRNKTVSSQL